jgi:hypothetical protein
MTKPEILVFVDKELFEGWCQLEEGCYQILKIWQKKTGSWVKSKGRWVFFGFLNF